MPYLSSVSPSVANTMSTAKHYHTTLTAAWISDYVYKLVFKIIREEKRSQDEIDRGATEGWHVQNSHKYRLVYYDKNENLVDTGEVSLRGTTIIVPLSDTDGEAGWNERSATILERTIETCKNPNKRKVIAMYTGTVDNTKYGGKIETPVFWSPSSDISKSPTLPDGPNTYVRSNGAWVRAKDIWVYSKSAWHMVPSGDMNVYSNSTWQS